MYMVTPTYGLSYNSYTYSFALKIVLVSQKPFVIKFSFLTTKDIQNILLVFNDVSKPVDCNALVCS